MRKQVISEGKAGSGTLVSNLARAPKQPQDPSTSSVGKVQMPLSIDEILGNILVFNFAGHDTTAISLAYALFPLVAHPKVQDWISEEIKLLHRIRDLIPLPSITRPRSLSSSGVLHGAVIQKGIHRAKAVPQDQAGEVWTMPGGRVMHVMRNSSGALLLQMRKAGECVRIP